MMAATATAVVVVVARSVGEVRGEVGGVVSGEVSGVVGGCVLCLMPTYRRNGINCNLFYSAWPAMPNKYLFISTYSGFILCLFQYKFGYKPFIPILTVTQYKCTYPTYFFPV
jgi:hypothetical protein